ncbi:type II secretion system F family protein [Rhodanobacter sp. 115]|uniref:type II secretion system F family protein n=1 Tax=Rhodanobacter sp. FW021-MT20 TaxID=1162282 RepID=UPI0034E4CF4C
MAILSATTNPSAAPVSSDPASWMERLRSFYDKLSFPLEVRAEFYRAMADFAAAGIKPFAAIEELCNVARIRWSKKKLVKVYEDVMTTMATGAEGEGLPMALTRWIPPAESVMLLGAQAAGPDTLNATFGELGQLLSRQAEARKKLKKAIWVNVGNLGVMIAVMIEVIATMVPVVDKSATPEAAARMPFAMAYFGTAEWILHNGVFLIVGFLAFCGGLAWAMPNWWGERRRFFDQWIPPFNIYQRLQTTLFLSTSAAMLRANITLNTIIDNMQQHSSRWMQFHLHTMKDSLAAGDGEVGALALGPLPNDTADSLRVYKLIPQFKDVMTRLSEDNFKRYERSIALISDFLSLFSTFLMAGFALCTLVAMFTFSNAMREATGH